FDDRFARHDRYEPPPEFPLASPYSGITPWSVFQDGPFAALSPASPRWCAPSGKRNIPNNARTHSVNSNERASLPCQNKSLRNTMPKTAPMPKTT
ncbi:hypothetical protein PTSG_11282, partial [Salpingoeca rosetta]